MPSKNCIKVYLKDGYYHLYNRGVAKQKIFKDRQDYMVFLKYLKYALSPHESLENVASRFESQGQSLHIPPRLPKNYAGKIDLIAYCLMPNHFHLLLKQLTDDSMRSFVSSVITRYSMYFNKRYDRVGPLFQGRYKAVIVANDNQLLHLSRYIHANPVQITDNLASWHSSYSDYLGTINSVWVNPDIALKFFKSHATSDFKNINSYKDFVENYIGNSAKTLGKLAIDL